MSPAQKTQQAFLLRLPSSLKEHALELAQEDGISLNHFISLALTERITRLETLYAEREKPNSPFGHFSGFGLRKFAEKRI